MRTPLWLAKWAAIPPSLLAFAIVAIVGGAYSNSLRVPFLLDDLTTIVGNPTITKLSPLREVLFPPGEIYSAGRPILNLSFALNYAIGGVSVQGYHIVNLSIHLAAALALFGLVRRTLVLRRGAALFCENANAVAFAIAILWATHPLLTSAVTYISQRAESLMGLFYLLTLYAFVRGSTQTGHAWTLVGVVACALGMATKEVMVTAPLVVFLFDVVFVAGSWREAWSQRKGRHLAHAATWGILIALMVSSRLGQRAVGWDHGLNWSDYLCLEQQAINLYLLRVFWPADLVFDYGANLPMPRVLALLGYFSLLGSLLAASLWGLVRGMVLGFLGTVFFLLLAPTSSIVPLAGQPIAENRMYLPLAAAIAATVIGWVKISPRVGLLLFIVALTGLTTLTHHRNEVYRTDESIWRDTVAKRPLNERAVVMWSEALKRAGHVDSAIEALRAMMSRKPDSPEIANNLAVALYQVGRNADSIEQFEAAVRLKPDYAGAYRNYGTVLYNTGNIPMALDRLLMAIKHGGADSDTVNLAGMCLVRLGRVAEARPHFERALQLNPNHPTAQTNLDWVRANIAPGGEK